VARCQVDDRLLKRGTRRSGRQFPADPYKQAFRFSGRPASATTPVMMGNADAVGIVSVPAAWVTPGGLTMLVPDRAAPEARELLGLDDLSTDE
jgi:hypothetical protein